MNDTVELKLPISGKTVIIRNYTTRADDAKAEEALYLGVKANQNSSDQGNMAMEFPISNVMAQTHIYVRRLVKAIDEDSSNIALALEDLRTQDYAAIEEAVTKIVEEQSPKVKAAKKN